ncbi:MAG: DUF2971 domain-containing protein [Muribaculaceae bacterium]|nr:DUF2971 domain-containing protein [Muribaculaceae bacterium]
MRIHHYTSIDTLKLILQNRTIRFNRSDQVDDPDEIELKINGIAFAKYLLISCWTIDERESIPQWGLYSGKSKGVRITLESNHLFQNFINSTRCYTHEQVIEKVWNKRYIQSNGIEIFAQGFPSTQKDCTYIPYYIRHGEYNPRLRSGLAIMPPQPNDNFLTIVEYVDTLNNIYDDQIKVKHNTDNTHNFRFNTHIGYKKKKDWSFQNEARFVLMLMHTLPQKWNGLIIDAPNYCFTEYEFPPIDSEGNELKYYDIEIDEDAFDYLEVIAGPETDDNDKRIIKDLLSKFAPNAQFRNSSLRTKFNK